MHLRRMLVSIAFLCISIVYLFDISQLILPFRFVALGYLIYMVMDHSLVGLNKWRTNNNYY